MNRARFWLVALVGTVPFASALANEFPALSGTLVLELDQKNWLQGPYYNNRNDLFGFAEANVSLRLSERFSMRAVATLEPLTDPHPQADRAFQNEDVRWKDVYAQYDDGVFGVRAGRITANFGVAWYAAPGLDATTLAEDYAVWDRMGVSTWYRLLNDHLGTTTISAALFSLDTSALSASWLDTRQKRSRDQGGPSNTAAPQSFALSINGTDIRGLPGFLWQVAVLRQKVDFLTDASGSRVDRVADEKGAVASIQQTIRIAERIETVTLGEVAGLNDRGGIPGASGRYLTVGETLRYGQWYASTALTTRWLESVSPASARDTLLTFSTGYDLTERLLLDAGWRRADYSASTYDDIRVRLRYLVVF